jgi:hypothetical protein
MWIRSQNRTQLQDVNRFVIEQFETGIYIVGNGCEDTISWLNDWYEGQQNVEYLAISKLGEGYDC